jgi:pyruvate formate lyase activating enzyme
MARARKAGIANVLVTNGCINGEAAREILALTDAANIDLKCFSPETYTKILGGDLQTVLDFTGTAFDMGVHVELTTLAVPGLNDGEAELDGAADFIAGLSPEIPYHLSAYHPDWRWNAPPTEPDRLIAAARRARRRLSHVYIGNAAAPSEFSGTSCPACGAVLVRRSGYSVDTSGLVFRKTETGQRCSCAECGARAPIRY